MLALKNKSAIVLYLYLLSCSSAKKILNYSTKNYFTQAKGYPKMKAHILIIIDSLPPIVTVRSIRASVLSSHYYSTFHLRPWHHVKTTHLFYKIYHNSKNFTISSRNLKSLAPMLWNDWSTCWRAVPRDYEAKKRKKK